MVIESFNPGSNIIFFLKPGVAKNNVAVRRVKISVELDDFSEKIRRFAAAVCGNVRSPEYPIGSMIACFPPDGLLTRFDCFARDFL